MATTERAVTPDPRVTPSLSYIFAGFPDTRGERFTDLHPDAPWCPECGATVGDQPRTGEPITFAWLCPVCRWAGETPRWEPPSGAEGAGGDDAR